MYDNTFFSVSNFFFHSKYFFITNIMFSCIFLVLVLFLIKKFIGNKVINFIFRNIYLVVVDINNKYFLSNNFSLILFNIFIVIMLNNLLGIISFPNLNSFPIFPAILTIFIISYSIYIGIKNKGFHVISDFFPKKIPWPVNILIFLIELFSTSIKPIILCLRLLLNITIGAILIHLVESIIVDLDIYGSLLLPLLFVIYLMKVFTAVLQAYLFCLFYSMFSQHITENLH